MKTSILICATCFIVTGCSAQLRFPSLSSALSSLTGFGNAASGQSQGAQSSGSSGAASPYSGLVRDYGRNLMMAMSSIYPTLFKPPQQQQQAQPSQAAPQYDQAFAPSQYSSQGLFPGQSSGPSFSFGGSTFSISPSLPFGSLTGASSQGQGQGPQASSGSHSPFSASFGSSINSPSSFGPLSSASFLQQASMPSFAPASSYNAAFDAANSGPAGAGFGSMSSAPGPQMHSSGSLSSSQLMSQSSNSNPINSYPSMSSFGGQHDSAPILGQQGPAQQAMGQASHAPGQFVGQHQQASSQFGSQQYRPDMMSIAASAPVPSSNSYSNYGNMPSASSSQQQGPSSQSSYQQPSYR